MSEGAASGSSTTGEEPAADQRSTASGHRRSPAVARALRVLETLAADTSRSFTLAELQRRHGFSHGNLHAILTTMEATGHVRRDRPSRSYRLGPALLTIGDAARAQYPEVELAYPHIMDLADELDTEAHAGMRAGQEILIVARAGPVQPLGYGVRVGERLPFMPPIGAAYVAWSSADEVANYLEQARDHLDSLELTELEHIIHTIRQRGYSVLKEGSAQQRLSTTASRIVDEASTDSEVEEIITELARELGHHSYVVGEAAELGLDTVTEVSAPVFDASGQVLMMVGVSVVSLRATQIALDAVVQSVVGTARRITRTINGRAPLPPRAETRDLGSR